VRSRERRRCAGSLRRRLPALAALALVLTGCGIRPTQVPTDFGAAPSRVPCTPSQPDTDQQRAHGIPVQVFLLCGASLVAVDRVVTVADGTDDDARRVAIAQGLLDQLAEEPSAGEKAAGYRTLVPRGLTASGPRAGDPQDALRLSTALSGLGSTALAQLVCTLSDSAAAEGDGSVVLGGPDDGGLHRYACTDAVRSGPGTTRPPSTPVTSG